MLIFIWSSCKTRHVIYIFNFDYVYRCDDRLFPAFPYLSPDHKITAFFLILLCGGVGAVLYALMAFKLHLSDKLFGPRGTRVVKKLGIK